METKSISEYIFGHLSDQTISLMIHDIKANHCGLGDGAL